MEAAEGCLFTRMRPSRRTLEIQALEMVQEPESEMKAKLIAWMERVSHSSNSRKTSYPPMQRPISIHRSCSKTPSNICLGAEIDEELTFFRNTRHWALKGARRAFSRDKKRSGNAPYSKSQASGNLIIGIGLSGHPKFSTLNPMNSHLRLPVVFLVGVLFVGCTTPNFRKASSTSSTLRDAALNIDNTLAPLDAVNVALYDLVNNPEANRTSQFTKFSAAVSDLESQAERLGKQAKEMRADNLAYLEQWDEELATIKNDDIQNRSEERKDEVAARMKKVRENYLRTAAELSPFLVNLRDLRTALSTDLTAGGIESISGLEKRVTFDAEQLRSSLIDLSVDFKSLGVSLSPKTI